MSIPVYCPNGHEITALEAETVVCAQCDAQSASTGSDKTLHEERQLSGISDHTPSDKTIVSTEEDNQQQRAVHQAEDVTAWSHRSAELDLATAGDLTADVRTREIPEEDGLPRVISGDSVGEFSKVDPTVIQPTFIRQAEETDEFRPRRKSRDGPPELPGYRILEELGRGGMGIVYRAIDQRTEAEVAVKTLQRMSPTGLQLFKQEFRALADIAHPNIASLHELVSDGSTWCFTMELLQGAEFLDYVLYEFDQPDEPVDRDEEDSHYQLTEPQMLRLQNSMQQLTIGLHTLHSNGKLHRDVKPSNVMMTTEGRLVLLDFGLIGNLVESTAPGKIIGTPSYMPPEQPAGQPTSPASDWYSVGVMLYEALTGQLPYKGRPCKVLEDKQSIDPPLAHQVAPSAPTELSAFCARLLSRDPGERPTAEEILDQFGAGELVSHLRSRGLNPSAVDVQLVGRESELAKLERTWQEVRQGNTRTVFVRGRSGMGKSVLISTFLGRISEARERDGHAAVILEGRCYEQESVPFKALDSLIDALAVYLGSLESDETRDLMPEDSSALTRLFPVLGQFRSNARGGQPSLQNADQQEIRQRALTALRTVFFRIGERRPLVLYIDDLQWGDEDSAGLLAELVRPPESPQLLLLGSYRSENMETSACLKELDEEYSKGDPPPHREDLDVESLSEEESKQLAMMLLGEANEPNRDLAGQIAQESGGWPFFVWELAQYVQQDAGAGLRQKSLELDEVIWSRACRLPEETRRLLELISVVGRPTLAAQAYRALGAVSQGPGLLAQLRTSSFVRLTEDEEGRAIAEPYHSRIRESVVAHLEQKTAEDHSLQLAEVIESASGFEAGQFEAHINATTDSVNAAELAQHPGLNKPQWDCVFDLASLFSAAGQGDRALPYALIAAEQAMRQEALEVAEDQYRIAEQAADGTTSEIRFRIADGLGSVLMMRGRYAEAKVRLSAALDLAESDLVRTKTEAKLGELAFKRGDMTQSAETLEAALTNSGERIPRNLFGYALGLFKEVAVQTLHSLLPRLFVHRRKTVPPEVERIRIKLLSRLSYVNWFARGAIPTLWSHLRELNLAEQYQPSLELAQAWSEHGPVMTMIPLHKRGIRHGEKSLEIRRSKNHLWGEGQSLHFIGISLHAACRVRESAEVWQEAITIFERTGDWWEANISRYHLGLAYYRLGDLKKAIDLSVQVHRSGLELGDEQACGISLHGWALPAHGNIPADILQTELARDRFDAQCTTLVLLAEAVRLYFADDLPQASERLDQALGVIRKNTLRNSYVAPVYSWRASTLRRRLANEPDGTTLHRKLLRRTTRAVWGALAISKSYRIESPHALREAGELALLHGQRKKARKRFEQSLAEAEKYELNYQAALTRVRLVELRNVDGDATVEELDSARQALTEMLADGQETENGHS